MRRIDRGTDKHFKGRTVLVHQLGQQGSPIFLLQSVNQAVVRRAVDQAAQDLKRLVERENALRTQVDSLYVADGGDILVNVVK